MINILSLLVMALLALLTASVSSAQNMSPLKDHHVWLPMTGVTEAQMDDARRAGYDTIMLKVLPPVVGEGESIDFASTDRLIAQATDRDFKVLLAILSWGGLADGRFWDTEESGDRIMNRLDPFWPEAMERVEWYYEQVIDHYKNNEQVIAFAPTWGIYGEAGFTSYTAGRSEHALARFNEWLLKENLPRVEILPTRKSGLNTEYNRFIRFRYLYLEEQFDAMISRLKQRAGALPVGMWQELYPVIAYLFTMVEVPSADFAVYESCFLFQTNHNPKKSLGETMGFRYRCKSAEDYRNYFLPIVARKRGEGQRFMGCQLSNDYVKNYGWTEEEAEAMGFDRWEDEFSPYLKKLMDAPLESPNRDVLLIFPTYAAAALTDHPCHLADAKIIDIILRMYGCQMERYGSPRLDKMSLAEMDRFSLIIVPSASYLMRDTWERLKRTKATVLLTGTFAQALNGEMTPFGGSRGVDGGLLEYFERPNASVTVTRKHAITAGLEKLMQSQPIKLDRDYTFRYKESSDMADVLLQADDEPLLSVRDDGRMIFIHGNLWAALCHNPDRVPPELGGSKDCSANEIDLWGPYDSSHPQNVFGYALMKNILDWAGVDYRVRNPKPRGLTPFLGDHVEQVSISANIIYNNTAERQSITVRTPFRTEGYCSRLVEGHYETRVRIAPFSYVGLPLPRETR